MCFVCFTFRYEYMAIELLPIYLIYKKHWQDCNTEMKIKFNVTKILAQLVT